MKFIRWLERFSRPRLTFLFDHRLSNIVFGLLVIAGCAGAFLAPPFTGLDTLPALGVVLLSLGVLLEDFLLVVLGVAVGVAGVVPGDRARQGRGQGHRQPVLSTRSARDQVVSEPIRVTVWGENVHEREEEHVRALYPDGMHAAIAAGLTARLGDRVSRAHRDARRARARPHAMPCSPRPTC